MISTPSGNSFDYVIAGGGVIGLALAKALRAKHPSARIVVLEKETEVAQHASGRNSGVLHAGFYYSADSLKARLCVAGNRRLRDYCSEKGIPVNECGKLVIATSQEEVPRLAELERRGRVNGAGVEFISETDALKIQPGIRPYGNVLYSPRTATSDPKLVAQALAAELTEQGVEIRRGCSFIRRENAALRTSTGVISAGLFINAAGLYADTIAKQFGFGTDFTIIPFKGLYLKYKKNKLDVTTNIYPVPDPAYPFLGVHFTKTLDGTIKIGPTAIPALWRENYHGFSRFNMGELLEIGAWETRLFFSNAFNFRNLAFLEMRKYARSHFIGLAQKLLPTIDPDGFGDFSPPGIRAQLLNKKTQELVQDFIIEGDSRSIHILNAVSPGWTCCFPFADHVIENYIST